MAVFFLCTSLLSIPDAVKQPTSDDICLAWVVKDEARGESQRGQKAVLDVVMKRMETRKLTACEVVKQPKQFSGYKQGTELRLHENVSEEDLTKLYELYRMEPVVKNSEYFHAEYVKPAWRKKYERIKQIGKHIFYNQKEKHK